jgi:undecaprenyl-diphosphatase
MTAPRTTRAAALAAGALASLALSSTPAGRRLDSALFRATNRSRGPAVDRLLWGVTELGSLYAAAAAAAVVASTGRRREAARALSAAGAMWALGQALKRFVVRARPYDADPPISGLRLLIARPRGTSWPSSHPAVLAAFLAVAARELGLRSGPRIALASLATTVGASRVALGVHYPSDVVGGLLLGRAVALAWDSDTGIRR